MNDRLVVFTYPDSSKVLLMRESKFSPPGEVKILGYREIPEKHKDGKWYDQPRVATPGRKPKHSKLGLG